MITRSQYLAKEFTFSEYFGQYVHMFRGRILNRWSAAYLAKKYKEDKQFNNIPLNDWGTLCLGAERAMLEFNAQHNCKDGISKSDMVCAAKLAAQQIARDFLDATEGD